ncbi:RNA pseudouridylate synthase [Nitzschia inconspicua]|uniref:RNA pseudouridylate synthase n=1 Tax=Nitzschia inconspicua TaxID=303405 RepID=A0A9K3LGF1_9STRA|nr:RNA pseudouridylate synthase [Nitzschia inconspicua]
MIESGRVTVNGIPVTEKGGFKVRPFCDVVTLDGKTIEGWEAMNGIVADTEPGEAVPTSQKKRNASSNELQNDDTSHNSKTFEYIKYWKPRGITCTTDRTVPSNIIDDLFNERGYNPRHRIYPVGRLDKDTSGLIVLTSDGRLPNSALRGQFKQPKWHSVMGIVANLLRHPPYHVVWNASLILNDEESP